MPTRRSWWETMALQFHPEVTVQGLERWYVGHATELAQAGICVRRLREESRTFGPELETAGRQVWRQWLDHLFHLTGKPGLF
jgi:GMP synthase (glutamine-hydrolysing)